MPRKPKKTTQPPEAAAPAAPPSELSDEDRNRSIVQNARERRASQENRRADVRIDMMRSVVTEPLLSKVQLAQKEGRTGDEFDVIVSLNETFQGGIAEAERLVKERADLWKIPRNRIRTVSHYVFVCLTADQVLELAREAREVIQKGGVNASVIYRIWEDSEITVQLTRSVTTVKADAALRSFQAGGNGIVWAVLDSGIQQDHPHFQPKDTPAGQIDTLNLSLNAPLTHMDFTPLQNGATVDLFGHGTHVAGIIAGYWKSPDPAGQPVAITELRDEGRDQPIVQREKLKEISGVAPACKLLSMKVVADTGGRDAIRQTAGQGKVSWILLAIAQIQEWNQNGKRLLVHGVNMSLGYDFDPRWFACGHSPICVEVNRLVKSGVSVVVSAGNAGYSSFITAAQNAVNRYSDTTISDPGNADLAITVGSTHREMPHMYGVSYFSSRGPTGDGRMKPDIVAPGERIISCAAGLEVAKGGGTAADPPVLYCEQTGTSMAAPHVSGAIAAFLSVRREFIGEPERVKQIFLDSAVDLGRERKFQGAGLVDLMKALQAV